jgi:DNA-binding transcriptional MerR regulator
VLIGELARRTGVSPRLLRYYEAQGLLRTRRGPNGYRHYDGDALIVVRQVRALLEAGLTTEVIRELLPCVRGERPDIELCDDVQALLGRQLAALDERIDELSRNRGALAAYLARS